jgi:iron complex outermembrane receptor protein
MAALNRRASRLVMTVAMLSSGFALPAAAQTDAAPPVALEASETTEAPSSDGDIIVTAQRKDERLQNVGIAITAFSGESLERQGITSSADIASLTPGVNLSGTYGGQSVQFSIRGVTQSDFNDAIEAPVAVYVDDIYIASQQGQSMALFDIARVEALKGPQGTLFGRNATGGLVHFVVQKPQLGEFSGKLSGTYGRFKTKVVEGALNIPLGESVAIRASGIWDYNGAMWKNVYPAGQNPAAIETFLPRDFPVGDDLGRKDSLSGRLQFLADLGDDWQVRLTASGTRQRFSESPWMSVVAAPVVDANGNVVNTVSIDANDTRSVIGPDGNNYFNPGIFAFQAFQQGNGPIFAPTGASMTRFPGQTWFGYSPVDIGKRQLSKDYAQSDLNRFDAYGFAAHIDGRVGASDFTLVSGYNRYKKTFLLDADSSPGNIFLFGNKADIQTFSTEARLAHDGDAFDWQAGLYYLHDNAFNAQGILGPTGSYFALVFDLPPAAGGFGIPGALAQGVDPLAVFRLKTNSYSAFGQVNWEFVPQLTVVVGGRLIREVQGYDYKTQIFLSKGDYTVDLGSDAESLGSIYAPFNDHRSKTYWAGKVQLEYRPDSRLLIYAGVNRGVKGGSYNGQYFDASAGLNPADIPYKQETLLSYEAGFKYTGRGFRFNGTAFHYDYSDYQSYLFQGLRGQVTNLDAKSTGVELDGSVTPFPGLELSGQLAYIHARVLDFPLTPTQAIDVRPTYTPKWSGAARISYTTSVGADELRFGADMSLKSNFYHNARNFDADLLPGYALFDADINYEMANGFSLGAFVKNIFDKRYAVVGLDLSGACGCNLQAYGQPMTWGVKAGYKF